MPPSAAQSAQPAASLDQVRRMIHACMQCGTCSASCPNEFAMDQTPRRLWRMVLMGREAELFRSRTFSLCSSCYTCSLRCPRGLPLTDAMAALKQIAARQGVASYHKGTLFYQSFLQSVRQHGRVQEMAFMSMYFARLRHPLEPFRFAPLGVKLIRKGKLELQIPSRGSGKLAAIFSKVEAIETDNQTAQGRGGK